MYSAIKKNARVLDTALHQLIKIQNKLVQAEGLIEASSATQNEKAQMLATITDIKELLDAEGLENIPVEPKSPNGTDKPTKAVVNTLDSFNFLDISKVNFPTAQINQQGGIVQFMKDRYNVHIIAGAEYIQTPFLRVEMGAKCCPEFETLMKVFCKIKGFSKPTSCQKISWPCLLQGHNLICISKTGSGKTFSFMIPGLVHAIHVRRAMNIKHSLTSATPVMLVIGPTRELVLQIKESSDDFANKIGVYIAAVYGGEANRNNQHKELGEDPICICGTPGRLKDFIGDGIIDLSRTTLLILDEADRMLDMKFGRDIQKIASSIPEDRQVGFFSATWQTTGIASRLAESLMSDKHARVHVQIGDISDGDYSLVESVCKEVKIFTQENEKKRFLENLFSVSGPRSIPERYHKYAKSKCVIFCNTKDQVSRLHQQLEYASVNCNIISSSLSQEAREKVVNNFKEGKLTLLIATDVIGRGIDIDDINIINYEYPNSGKEGFTHRIGRSGRAGKEGFALTLLSHRELEGKAAKEMYELLDGAADRDELLPWLNGSS